MGDRTSRRLDHAATLLSGLVVLGVVSMPGWATTSETPHASDAPRRSTATAEAPVDEVDLDGPTVEDVRDLPLLDPDGEVATTFVGGAGLDDELLVRDASRRLAVDSGLPAEFADEVWAALEVSVPSTDLPDFPYRYPSLTFVDSYLSEAVVEAHAPQLRELSALFALAAGASPAPDDVFLAVNKGLTAAQAILQRVAAVDPSCDSQVMQAWAVTLGESPRPAALEEVWQAAIDACPGDPTPRWWWGHRLLEDSVSDGLYFWDGTRIEAMRRPLDFFDDWVADGGGSAAHAGLAEALLSQAEALQLAGAMPFTVRDYATRAMSTFERLEASDPSTVNSLAVARAAYVLGDESASQRIDALDPSRLSPAARAVATFIHERLGEFEKAAMAAAPDTPDPPSLALVASNRSSLLPLTWAHGVDARAETLFDATFTEGGGGDVAWLGIVPEYRRDYRLTTTSSDMSMCRAHAKALNLVLAGLYDDARAVDLSSDGPRDSDCLNLISPGDAADRIELGYSELVSWDDAQNLLRYGGDLETAGLVIQSWLDEGENPLARQRQGEVAFLTEDWPSAVASFEAAASTYEGAIIDDYGAEWNSADVRESWLMLGLAEERSSHPEAALDAYASAIGIGPADSMAGGADESNLASAHLRTAALLTERGDMSSSLPHRQAAAEIAEAHDGPGDWADRDVLNRAIPLSSGAEYNNYAVGLLDQDRLPEQARKYAQRAVDLDPMNPVYLETLAQAQEKSGDPVAAEKTYESATDRDATTFQSLNNRAVIQAGKGQRAEAIQDLRAAVAAKPDYAIAWFNLGIVLGEGTSFSDFAQSQASFARAVSLDGDLRGESAVLRSDTSAFQTDLDVSRSIAPGWTVGGSARSTTQSIGWILALMALVRLAFALGLDKVIEVATGRVLAPRRVRQGLASRAWIGLDRPTGVLIAVLATGAIAAWPLLGASTSGLVTVVATLAVTLSVTCLFVVAAGGQRRGWVPSMLVGVSTAAFGYSVVPAPVDARPTASTRERWGGSIVVGILAIAALSIAYATGMPSVRWIGLVALGLLTTSLLPLRPFDGAQPMPRPVSAAVALALLAVTGGVAMAWW